MTGVKTSPDLRHARVYVSVLGDDPERSASIDGLRSAHGFLQRRLADELTLKHTPSLTFEYDDIGGSRACASRSCSTSTSPRRRPVTD